MTDFTGDLFRDFDSLKAQLIEDDGTLSIYNKDTEVVPITCTTIRVSQVLHGHDFIFGHPTNGRLGSGMLGIDGQQVTLGNSGIQSTTVVQVLSLNDTYEETLRTTDFVDTNNTTATVDTTNYLIQF